MAVGTPLPALQRGTWPCRGLRKRPAVVALASRRPMQYQESLAELRAHRRNRPVRREIRLLCGQGEVGGCTQMSEGSEREDVSCKSGTHQQHQRTCRCQGGPMSSLLPASESPLPGGCRGWLALPDTPCSACAGRYRLVMAAGNQRVLAHAAASARARRAQGRGGEGGHHQKSHQHPAEAVAGW